MDHTASSLPFAVGDWVTQYSAGYWKVVAIYDKYADEDDWRNPPTYRKGDHISYWVVLKKGFTPQDEMEQRLRVRGRVLVRPRHSRGKGRH